MHLNKNHRSWKAREGSSYPLGVSYIREEDSFNFAVYTKHATQVTLLVFSENDFVNPFYVYSFDPLINKSNRVWHCRITAETLGSARYYAYKMQGPRPQSQVEWHAFHKEKVLLDPYARAVLFPPNFSREAACRPGDNSGKAPLGIFVKEDDGFDWMDDQYQHHESDLVIYEVHIKGFTKHPNSGVKDEWKGTYSGLIEKIPYLKELGITAVELMPVYQFDPQSQDYWGYTPLNFFSPHRGYASSTEGSAPLNEFKTMVRELHKAGLEVILDVVYNHTTEGDHHGPVYSFKGIDNSTYYLINEDLADPYFNYSGTGNTLHTRNSYVRRMIMDSLRYWRKEMHVDGFRFDLASVFSRNTDGSLSFDEPPIFGMIGSDPDLAEARLIAEPWDAVGTSQLGKKFPGVIWMQWNSLFRDHVRRFVRGDNGMLTEMGRRLYGSADLFPDDLADAYHPFQSVNYINAHDGFTLYDLVSYNQKHNVANGHNNSDGAQENFSWNCGREGSEDLPPEVLELRKKQARNFCVLLFISNGTPMFVAGDEFLRTQKGNNNPYNQDNETSWIDWNFRDRHHDFFEFFKKMIAFRKNHPTLSRSRFWRKDVEWFGLNGEPDTGYYSKAVAFYLNGKTELDDDLYVMVNAYWEELIFSFQKPGPWLCIINTANPPPADFAEEDSAITAQENFSVAPRSIAVFVRKRSVDPVSDHIH